MYSLPLKTIVIYQDSKEITIQFSSWSISMALFPEAKHYLSSHRLKNTAVVYRKRSLNLLLHLSSMKAKIVKRRNKDNFSKNFGKNLFRIWIIFRKMLKSITNWLKNYLNYFLWQIYSLLPYRISKDNALSKTNRLEVEIILYLNILLIYALISPLNLLNKIIRKISIWIKKLTAKCHRQWSQKKLYKML